MSTEFNLVLEMLGYIYDTGETTDLAGVEPGDMAFFVEMANIIPHATYVEFYDEIVAVLEQHHRVSDMDVSEKKAHSDKMNELSERLELALTSSSNARAQDKVSDVFCGLLDLAKKG